jgi:hypothetical protein
MKPQEFAELLEGFRATEEPCAVMLVADDPLARRVLAAWVHYPAVAVVPDEDPPADERARWRWAWEPSWEALDLEELARAVGLPAAELESKLHVMINARLMYPDGTIAKLARSVLHQAAAAMLKATRKK